MKFKFLAAAFAATALAAGGAHANLLINGGFETGDFTGWSVSQVGYVCSGPSAVCGVSDVLSGAQSGSYYVSDGTAGEQDVISQTFSDTVGQVYKVSAWAASDGLCTYGCSGMGNYSFAIDSTTFASVDPVTQTGWTEYTTTFVGTGSDTFVISDRSDPANNYFDSINVSAAPEPTAWALLVTGFGLAGAGLRRRKAAIAV